MRNLEAINCVALPAESTIARAQCFCLDCDRGVIWVATNNELCSIEDNNVSSVAMLTGHMMSGDKVVGMEFVSDLESVCLALSGGDILTYCTTTDLIECVGCVEVGVVCMGWSPEQDVVVLVTREQKLLLMTREFDPLTETSLHPDDFGEAKPVTVGWGKKETQFHGSEGKTKAKMVVEKPLCPALDWDDLNTRISWRGDGEYFVCSSIDPSSKSRQLRVWSRECVLHSTGERVDGLGQALCWRPNGNLIASTQQKPHRHDVIFFERNGLQHGEFPLHCANKDDGRDLHVKELAWSCDSNVLALWLEVVEEDGEVGAMENGTAGNPVSSKLSKTYVQLWTVGNYHWYLKQEIRLTSSKKASHTIHTPSGLFGMIWDPISPLKLHLLTTGGQYLCYNWRWSIAESKSHSSSNSASVGVIDGTNILLTPFRHVVIPPPMAAHTLKLPIPVNQLVFSPPPNCNDVLALLATGQLALFKYNGCALNGVTSEERAKGKDAQGFRQITQAPELIGISNLPDDNDGGDCYCLHSLRQLVWWKPDRLLAVSVNDDNGRDKLVELSLCVDNDAQTVQVKKCHSLSVPEPVLCLHANPDTHTAIVQLLSGTILKYTNPNSCLSGPSDLADGNISPPVLSSWLLHDGTELKFPEQACEQIALVTFGEQECVVGLCEFRRSFYIGNKKIVTGCTSFGIHDEFLLLTTDGHTCRVIPLSSNIDALTPITPQSSHTFDESVRRIERGSKIVTVVTNSTRLVLQMPRGNLETISPRALILSSVRKDLDQLAFRSAFQTMRKHRINLNLMYDHSPKCFVENVQVFVLQLNSVADINLFLTELKEEDVTKTMYPGLGCSRDGGEGGEGGKGCKVDSVCDAVRGALVQLGENKYLLSIITTHVKKTQSDLETVLSIIKKLKEEKEEEPSFEGASDCVTAEEALKYTLFLVDVNQLFNVALGMYDFNLVLMVAEKSQKDPKEYLPFLNELRKLPVDYQRYRIDLFLRRFSKALGHISKCGVEKFPECLSFIKEHSLYTEALGIYGNRSSDEYKAIARAYGEHLVEKGKQRDAGIIFTQCACLLEAMLAFEKASCWRQVFTISAQLQEPPAKRIETARRISNALKGNRHYQEAARVLIDYAEDIEEAVVTLLEGNCWEEMLRLAHLFHRTDLIETHLRPSLLDAQQSHLSLFDDLQSTFLRHSARLGVVREQKRLKQAAILEGTYAADDKDADLFSDTSSITGRSAITSTTGTSLSSKTSGRSSKNRRKAERKKHSLREGSAHEDSALLEALTDIVSTVDRQQDEVSSLLGMLVQYGYVSEARVIQTTFSQLLETVKSNISSIWLPQSEQGLPSSAIQSVTGPATTVNSIVAALASSQAKSTPAGGAPVVSSPRLRDNVNWKLDLFL